MRFLFVNGVNLNMTGRREKKIYGGRTLDEINARIKDYVSSQGDEAEFIQTNLEGEICSAIQNAFLDKNFDGVILNAGAYSHYSYAIRDAIKSVELPVVEVHISNVKAREKFRKKSVLSEVCSGTAFGFGEESYLAGYVGLKERLVREREQ